MKNLFQDTDLKFLADKTCLVLSDAFPPEALGGAEVSLLENLKHLPQDEKDALVVVSFSAKRGAVQLRTVEGLDVMHLPEHAGWPHESEFAFDLKHRMDQPGFDAVAFGRWTKVKRLVGSPHPRQVLSAYREARARPKGGIVTDHLISQADVRLRHLLQIVRAMGRIEKLICDNTRSILIGSAALNVMDETPAQTTAIVRDNRFFCPRPNQSRTVRNKICNSCNFACASDDVGSKAVDLRRANLSLTRKHRIDALSQFGDIIVTSHELNRQISDILPDRSRIRRIPNTFGNRALIEDWTGSIEQSPSPRLLIIGMLNENKGQLAFLKAAEHWLRERPDVKIVIAGRGQRIGSQIEAFVEANGFAGQIEMPGYLERADLFEEIARASLVLAPTVWPEPFGRVPLEAGICGRATVAFAVGGLNESILDGHNGFLVEPGDYQGLLDRVSQLIDDPDLNQDMGERAQEFIAGHFGPSETIEPFLRIVFDHDLAAAAPPSKHQLPEISADGGLRREDCTDAN